jgi:hypothetical protein
MIKLITYKSSDFVRSVSYNNYLPRKDDLIAFEGAKYKIVQVVFPIPETGAVEIYLEKVD